MIVILALIGVLITHWSSSRELQGSDDKSPADKQANTDKAAAEETQAEQPEPEAEDELTATGMDSDSAAEKSGEKKKSSEPVTVIEEEEDQSATSEAKGPDRLAAVTVFVLAIFVGFEVITKVPPTLHTPLMSGSNAVSGITVVGAIVVAGQQGWLSSWLGMVAVALAMVNVVGGFLVTHRMLAMFKKR
jgi:NAD(P) transhydrogenase subunit alpha